MSYRNHTLLSLTLSMLAIMVAVPSARATTVINGSLFDVSYDETQFLTSGGFGLSGNVASYSPEFPLVVTGTMALDNFGSFDIIPHAGVALQSVTMNVSGFYGNLPDSTTLTHTGALTVNGDARNVYPFVFSSFTSGSWSTSATVDALTAGNAAVFFNNGLSAFSSGFGDATVSIDSISFNVTTVPIPAAVWLFGSGLLGLISTAHGKRAVV